MPTIIDSKNMRINIGMKALFTRDFEHTKKRRHFVPLFSILLIVVKQMLEWMLVYFHEEIYRTNIGAILVYISCY